MNFDEAYQNTKDIKRHGCHESEMEKLWDLANQVPEDGVIVEIGSFYGASTVLMAQSGRQIYAIDMFKGGFDATGDSHEEMSSAFKEKVLNKYGNVQLLMMDSKKAIKHFRRKQIDMIFIDGDHSFEGIDSDCRLYLPRLKESGIAAFHDYFNESFPGVKAAVDYHTLGWHTVCDQWSLKVKQKRKV